MSQSKPLNYDDKLPDARRPHDETDCLMPTPYWVPPGVELDKWPPELVADVVSIINPAYRQLVLLAKPGLAQSTGLTIVYLMWLEIIDQVQISRRLLAPGIDTY